jgi:hypothetical protein
MSEGRGQKSEIGSQKLEIGSYEVERVRRKK